MATTLLAGAGAEVDLGLPSGTDYLIDTYFTKNNDLYNALKECYGNIAANDPLFPPYQRDFLFNKASNTFTQLLDNLGSNFIASVLDDTPVEELVSVDRLSAEQREFLFKTLIESSESPLKTQVSDDLQNCNYYGILESLFSCLLNPRDNPAKFWRLINFYWSAYFSIVMPLLQTDYAKSCGIRADYTYALNNLAYITEKIRSSDFWMSLNKDSYYHTAAQRFDYVLTTNYTPFCKHLVKHPEEDAVYLSGSIMQFESARDFELYDPEDVFATDETAQCLFPFMMTKAPIKPIINAAEVNVFAHAIKILNGTDELVVLGYSFNQDDAHICALVRNYLMNERRPKLTYLAYRSSNTQASAAEHEELKRGLRKALRVPEQIIERQCEIEYITDCHSQPFLDALDRISSNRCPSSDGQNDCGELPPSASL